MIYKITGKSFTHSDIYKEDGTHLGTLDFSIFDLKVRGKLHTDSGQDFSLEADSIFQKHFTVKEGSVAIGEINAKWFSGKLDLTSKKGLKYSLNWEGFFNNRLAMYNEAGVEVAHIRWHTQLFKLGHEWFLEIDDNYPDVNEEEMVMVICYFFSRVFGTPSVF